MNYLDINYLRKVGRNIRLHGNRFIQIDLGSGNERIHVWADHVPFAQAVPTWIHDHSFGFRSTVLSGTLINVDYWVRALPAIAGVEFEETPYHAYVTNPRKLSDTELVRADEHIYCAVPRTPQVIEQGLSYFIAPEAFHATTYIGHAITLMQKRQRIEGRMPRVLCRTNLRPDNAFDRYHYKSEELWEVVDAVLHNTSA